MARIVNFSLEMKDGHLVEKKIEELREHFDFEQAVVYVRDGRLARWLRINGYKAESEQIKALDMDDRLRENLSRILDVKISAGTVDLADIQDRHERLRLLKQYTARAEILALVEQTAFSQKEMDNLLAAGVKEIVLCNANFVIPLRERGISYHGVGKACAVIESKTPIWFEQLQIDFHDVKFDAAYQAVLDTCGQGMKEHETLEAWAAQARDWEDLADHGNVKAMLDLGYQWYTRLDGGDDPEKAFQWFFRASEEGSVEACKALVVCYTQGYGTARDAWKAVVCARRAASAGDAEIMRCLAAFYRHGYGMEADLDKAEEWNRKAEEREVAARLEPPAADADEALKISYSKATTIVPEATTIVPEATTVAPEATAVVPDREISEMWEVRQWLKERDLEAILLSGRPLPKVDEAALAFIRKAARYGHAEGEYFLERYEGRTDNSVHMMELKQSSWQKMAERGNIYAVAGLAENRRKGYGGLQDENAILQGARLAANQGKAHGIARFAQCYEEGWGLNMNYEKAFQWYSKAARKGDFWAMEKVAQCYEIGRGVPTDLRKAKKWRSKLEECWNKEVQLIG